MYVHTYVRTCVMHVAQNHKHGMQEIPHQRNVGKCYHFNKQITNILRTHSLGGSHDVMKNQGI